MSVDGGVEVVVDGTYTFTAPLGVEPAAHLEVPFPACRATYDSFRVELDDKEVPLQLGNQRDVATARLILKPGTSQRLRLRYRSRGLDRWSYAFGDATGRARDFELQVRTNFAAVDFSDDSLSPTHKEQSGRGWSLTWRFENLIAGTTDAHRGGSGLGLAIASTVAQAHGGSLSVTSAPGAGSTFELRLPRC